MAAIGAWVIEAHQTEEREETRPIRELEQKIMALAGEFGFGHLVHDDEECGLYEPSDALRVKGDFRRYLDEYDEIHFWEELIVRLTQRDTFLAMTDQEFAALNAKAKCEAQKPHQKRWVKEFEVHGLDRLEVVAEPRRKRKSSDPQKD